MTKKIVFAAGILSALMLAPVLALAVATAPQAAQKTATASQSSAYTLPIKSMMPAYGANTMYPCALQYQSSGANMMYQQPNPCGPYGYQTQFKFLNNGFAGNFGIWLGVMFVITVALIWAILLLVIALLWKLVCKHKHGK